MTFQFLAHAHVVEFKVFLPDRVPHSVLWRRTMIFRLLVLVPVVVFPLDRVRTAQWSRSSILRFLLEQGVTARGGAAVSRRRICCEDLQASLNAEYDELSAIGYARLSRRQMDRLDEILQELNEIDRIIQDSDWS